MSFCTNYNKFAEFLHKFKQAVEIDKQKDKKLRYNVWGTTSEHVSNLFKKGIESLPWNENNSQHIKRKIENALSRINESPESAADFIKDIINDEDGNNIEYSIALHELMESVKGEADKARNLGIEISKISNGVLPAIPLSRLAASIGRKIAYQKGYRFKSPDINPNTAAEIETLYYAIGKLALQGLEAKGYVELSEDTHTIQDYINQSDLKKDHVKTNVVTDKVLSISINEQKLGIKKNTPEADYFLNRTEADLSESRLGVIADILRAVRQITQPSTIELPDTTPGKSLEDLALRDDQNIGIDPETEKVRKKLYDTPVFVHNTIHDLLQLLNKESAKTGKSASQILKEKFSVSAELTSWLFGLKRSDDFSIDKKESVAGQNLSKTAPLDDLVEYYDVIQDGKTDPVGLHMWLKIGRNARLYYENSVLNPHSSKQSRYMLTAGKYTVDLGSADYDYLVYGISEALGDKELTYKDFTGEKAGKLDKALEVFNSYESGNTLSKKLSALSSLAIMFPGKDYVTLLTTMKAIKDIRNPANGKVTTEFQVSADATASGGTLTFLQALGTNPNVESFLQRIGILKKEDGSVEVTLGDLYGVMTEAITKFINGEPIPNLIGQDLSKLSTGARLLLEDTVNLLFDEGKSTRELSKDPTMTFVYGQGRQGAINTMARSLADRIIDNLDDPKTRKYLVRLFNDKEYSKLESRELKDTQGLYKKIVNELKSSDLTGQLYNIMDAAINEEFLADYKRRSEDVFALVKKVSTKRPFKILPAAAVLSGIKPTKENINKYGMPLTKVFEVSNKTPTGNDTVLTRRQKLTKTVADVSTIHGIDAAQLYHSLGKTMKDNGVVVIHDDVRGTVQDVRQMEDAYRKTTVDVISQYDVHQQIMNAIAAYDPELAESAEYKAVMDEITTTTEIKADIINKRFNENTNALIGDGDKFKEFSNPETKTEPKRKARSTESKKVDFDEDTKINEAVSLLNKLADESSIITKFIQSFNASKIKMGTSNLFIPSEDTITITGTDQGRGDGKKLDINNKEDRKLQKELIEHEIIHSVTLAQIIKALADIGSDANKEVMYFDKAIEQLRDKFRKDYEAFTNLPGEVSARLMHIFTKEDQAERIAEFVAVMASETDVANEIYSILDNSSKATIKERIKQFIQKIKDYFEVITDEDFEKEIDIEKLYSAIASTIEQGETMREQNYAETDRYINKFKDNLGAGKDYAAQGYSKNLNYLNYAVASMLNSRLESEGKKLIGHIHSKMKRVFPIYSDVANKLAGIYDESDALQQIVHSITGMGTDKNKKADILAKFAEVMAKQTAVINDQMGKFNQALISLNEEERKTVGRFVTEMPLHDYFVLASDLTTEEAIADEVALLEAEIKKMGKFSVIRTIDDLIAWNVKHDVNSRGRYFNLAADPVLQNNVLLQEKAQKLLALKSIIEIGAKDFERLLENTKLVNLIKDNSVANKLSMTENSGEYKIRDSLVMEYYKEPIQIQAVDLNELKNYQNGENTGWKVLELPKDNKLGIVYKKVIDSTDIMGAYTDIKLNSTDIEVDGRKRKYNGIVQTADGKFKLRLTKEQKLKLGMVEDFSQALVRSTAHSMAIQDSQIIRDTLLKKETRLKVGEDTTVIEDIVKSENVDNPWFIKLEGDMIYEKLPASVKAKYKPVGNRVSNVNNFNENVDLVRKDISHWLMGGSASSLFENPQMKWAMRILKDLVAGAKIGMVVLNPMKIANDNISNISYLGVMGVSPLYIAKNYKNIMKEFQDYSDIQRQIVQLKVQLVARADSDKLKKQLKHLQKRLSQNPLGNIHEKGFINSLGSDLVAKNADTLSGLQADMHSALEYLLTRKDGKKNYVSHFIMQLHNLGFNGEDFLTYIGKIAQKTSKTGEGMQKELDQVVDRLKEIRTEDDVVNYVSQYTTSPGSEAVRLGASMTDLTDVMAKETFYRHLVEIENMSPEDARIKVLDSFPDYKENMPLAIKQLSDVGIIMFPSFWLRIQKVIYRMVRDKPLNFSTELMMEELLNNNINTIFDANVINKSNTFGGLIHTPFEPIGVGSVIPTHIF